MAAGDILAVEIGADGWYADITVAGLSTGGTYALGLGALNRPETGAPKLALTVVSLGFDDTGAATTVTRTVYGTKQVRKPTPNEATNQETVVGSDVKVRVALSDYVYAKDNTGGGNSGTAVTATLLSGLYTQASTPSAAASGVTVTNSSTRAYPKVVGNWTWPHNNLLGATIVPRAVAFHSSARSGRPVRCVKFTATDTHSNTVTQVVTAATYDSTMSDANPVVEYIGSLSTSTLTQGDVVTCQFIAYPWIGDTAACLDTSAGTADPSPLYGPRTNICDKSGTYGRSYATVDATNGNDGTGAVVASGLPTLPFLTMAAAYNALRTYNNTNYARNNCGGSVIYLKDGNYAYMGGSVTVGTTPSVWLEITKHPSATGTVAITSQSGGQSAGLLLKISNVNFSAQSAIGVIAPGGVATVWWDQLVVNCPTGSQPPVYAGNATSLLWHVTRCTITNLAQGLRPFGVTNQPMGVIRGNTITDTAGTNVIFATTMVGNVKTGLGAGFSVFDTLAGQTIPTPTNTIVAYNRLTYGLTSNAGVALRMGALTESHGIAIVQNVLENSASGVVGALLQVAADSTTGTPVNNVLLWHNTVVGQRINIAYNELGVFSLERWGWSLKNNLMDDWNIKSDTFPTANAARIGNWPVMYGVGCSGNLPVETTGIGAPGSFLFEFPGLTSDQPAGSGSPPTGSARAATYPVFADRRSFDGSSAGAGNGDYHIAATSPAAGLERDWLLPFGVAGAARGATDGAGAFTPTGGALVAAGFFATT